jgi:hypothetical protein
MRERPGASQLTALAALSAGAFAIGGSGIFVRLSQTGPMVTVFWRDCLALALCANHSDACGLLRAPLLR